MQPDGFGRIERETGARLMKRTGVLVAVAVMSAAAVFAGEPADGAAPAATPPNAALNTPESKEKWRFSARGRRDPFTFAKVTKAKIKPVTEKDPGRITQVDSKDVLAPEEIQKKRDAAQKKYDAAELALMEGAARNSVERCDEGLAVFRDVQNLGSYRELQEVREKLYRLRKAAVRLKERIDADSEFLALGLRITGIVSRERKAQTIVNGAIRNKGDVISATSEGSEVVVDEIRPDQVIFLYKTYRMSLPLTDNVSGR
jgi:hypothetical protein